MQTIKECIGFDRKGLIDLALLLGSDYTLGVNGVGLVHAVEILHEFGDLNEFKQWFDKQSEAQNKDEQIAGKSPLKKKLQKIRSTTNLPETFPSAQVVEAYLKPGTDHSTDSFSWSLPDLDSLRTLACGKFGWTEVKVDTHLLPIMKKVSEKKESQAKIDQFFIPQPQNANHKLKSKRLNTAVLKMLNKAPPGEPAKIRENNHKKKRKIPNKAETETELPTRTHKKRKSNK